MQLIKVDDEGYDQNYKLAKVGDEGRYKEISEQDRI
jgi:hypothetical protein